MSDGTVQVERVPDVGLETHRADSGYHCGF